jgi:hypothetical protein
VTDETVTDGGLHGRADAALIAEYGRRLGL